MSKKKNKEKVIKTFKATSEESRKYLSFAKKQFEGNFSDLCRTALNQYIGGVDASSLREKR